MESMLRVAITGNIASGKSAVEKFLKENNLKVLDTDEVAHSLLNKESVEKEVVEAFSGLDILEDNKISRYKLGKEEGEKVAFVSIPLLFEVGFENLFDKITLVYSPNELRLQRLMSRNDLTLEEAQNRLDIQQNQDEKKLLADYVIYNDKDLNELGYRTKVTLKRLLDCTFLL